MRERLFCYGTLEFPEVFRLLTGESQSGEQAVLDEYERRYMRSGPWPGLVPAPGAAVHGTCVPVESAMLSLFDRYEGDEYERVIREVRTHTGVVSAWVYLPRAGLTTERIWDSEEFAREYLREYLEDLGREVSSFSRGVTDVDTRLGAHGRSRPDT
jgi:gamma-glutamylcyclotransferase (GGCT)/AIG2-like uncharacterized protein YtfP